MRLSSGIKMAIAFVVGAAAGGGTVYAVTKSKFEKKTEEEIENIKQYYGKKARVEKEKVKEEPVEEAQEEAPVERKARPTKNAPVNNYDEKVENLGYAQESSVKKGKKSKTKAPYLIDYDDYDENMPGHDHIALSYYAVDGEFANAEEELVEIPTEFIGSDNLNHFGYIADYPDMILVRNEALKIDYEINLIEESFTETHSLTEGD